MTAIKKKQFKLNNRFYLFISLLTVIAVSIVYMLFFAPKYTQALNGQIVFETSFNGVIVRNETVYQTTNYGKISFIAQEGERVAIGDKLVDVYKWGYNEKTLSELVDVRQQIMDYQVGTLLKNIINVNLEDYNDQIKEKSEQIRQTIVGLTGGNLIVLESELNALLDDRREYLKTAVPLDNTLNELYGKETALLEVINGWKSSVFSDKEAIVSFYFDGAETYFTPDNIEKMTIKTINAALDGAVTSKVSDSSSLPIYRLVDANDWKVIVITDRASEEIVTGSTLNVVFEDVYDKQYSAKVESEMKDKNGYMYVLTLTDDIGELYSARQVKMAIRNTVEGIKVPSKAITVQNGVYYITVRTDGGDAEIPVKVLARQKGSAIVEPVIAGSLSEGTMVRY